MRQASATSDVADVFIPTHRRTGASMTDKIGMSRDPDNLGRVLGWATFRKEPWHLGGVFATKNEAQRKRDELGQGYSVDFGSHLPGTDDFVGHGL